MRAIPLPGRAGRLTRAAVPCLVLALGAGAGSPRAEDALDAARARLRSSDKWVRAEAVEELGRIGTRAAWELVAGALADPKGEVADAAQLVLAGLDEPKELELLAEESGLRSKDPLVRARAAEVLGRLAAAPRTRLLEKALDDDEAEVRRMAAWSVERLARTGKLEEPAQAELRDDLVRHARSERDALVRARALAALSVLDPAAARVPLEEARRDRDARVRGAAAAQLGAVLGAGAVAWLGTLSADPEPSVRRVAAESLAELGTREALARLVERLALESEERLSLRLVEHLQGASGLKHRRDPRPWNDWLRTLPPDWKAGSVRHAPAEHAGGGTSAALVGLPIVSRRVTILIDLSGSIWNVRGDGKTRKQVIDAKLRETLEGLPAETRFNLIPYTGEPIPWRPELAPATPARVREAASWFEARRESGSGNFWDAAMLALEDPEVDTLIVLFDGAPTGGSRHRLELIVPLFLERNQARRVAVDLVLVDASRKLQRLWGELAQGTGGRLVAVSF